MNRRKFLRGAVVAAAATAIPVATVNAVVDARAEAVRLLSSLHPDVKWDAIIGMAMESGQAKSEGLNAEEHYLMIYRQGGHSDIDDKRIMEIGRNVVDAYMRRAL